MRLKLQEIKCVKLCCHCLRLDLAKQAQLFQGKKKPGLRCGCVLGCAGTEPLLPTTCMMRKSGFLHTHPAGKRCLKGKSPALVVQESKIK